MVATFDASLAGMSAEMFIERILLAQLGIEGAVIGFNFRFGRGRLGTAETLAEAGQRLGFSVSILDQVGCADTVITSSAVRSGLRDGDILSANRLLGYRWFVIGDIVPGEKRGRELGYPTANIDLWPECDLRHGVYAVTLQLADGSRHDGVASFGRRPTFGEGKALLEVHAFDFDGDLYGQTVTVAFVDWLRPEQKFSSAADLVEAMNRDRDHAARKLAAPHRRPASTGHWRLCLNCDELVADNGFVYQTRGLCRNFASIQFDFRCDMLGRQRCG